MPLIKNDSVTIISITCLKGNTKTNVFGLGDDGNVYLWNYYDTKWLSYNGDTPSGLI